MDFFERQEIARHNTRWLEVYFALSVIATVLTIYLAAVLVCGIERGRQYHADVVVQWWDPTLFLTVTSITLVIIGCGSVCKIVELSGGGGTVAQMLGGRVVNGQTTSPLEKRLLNVVEEMAIASGTPVPQVYLLPNEDGINAFAAGHTTGDMAICVTNGALKYLTRDELQGVIGHEFSHILNGDMRLNLRLMGIVAGILFLTLLGKVLLQTRGEKNPLPLVGLLLIVIGATGAFFAKLIKSAVSREREVLADASAVQFTRNPEGLANALKKVGSDGSRLNAANAEEASHLFFANGLTESYFDWMSTHPPLEERIRALDPAWDGQFIQVEETSIEDRVAELRAKEEASGPDISAPVSSRPFQNMVTKQRLVGVLGAAAIASTDLLPKVGAPTARHLDYAADIMDKLPEPLTTAAHSPMSAVALIYNLLLSSDEKVRATELQMLQADPVIHQESIRLLPFTQALESRARLPLATVSITALRSLSPTQYAQFTANLQSIMASNGQGDLFAYVLQKIVLRRLDPKFNPPKKAVVRFYAIKQVQSDCAEVLSALACAGQTESDAIENAFRQGVQLLDLPDDTLALDPTAFDLAKIDAALNRLNQSTPQIKKLILNACAETVAADGVIQENEAELLRAIADTLDCPIPPFLSL